MTFNCGTCGGWNAEGVPWKGREGYPCLCLLCWDCGDSYGSAEESKEWNDEQFEEHARAAH